MVEPKGHQRLLSDGPVGLVERALIELRRSIRIPPNGALFMYALIRTFIDIGNRLRGRLIVLTLRMRGAIVGRGVRIGRRVHFEIGRGATLEIGDRCIIDTNSFVTVADGASLHIGRDTFIFHNCDISSASMVRIGEYCSLAPYVTVIDTDHRYEEKGRPIRFQGGKAEPIVIEDEVWIATRAVVLKGVHIGKHSVVAAGSVVNRDIPSNAVAAGVPAKIVREF
jgi:acetyltransferase-like isoleucine patch superfamily enzyme